MKVATAAVPQLHVRAGSTVTAAALYRMAGLAIAVGVPTLFWTLALALVARSFGVAIAIPALAAFALIVATACAAGASLVMGNRE